jgi:hypothetical protein
MVSCGYFSGCSIASSSVSRLSTLMLTWRNTGLRHGRALRADQDNFECAGAVHALDPFQLDVTGC